MVKHKITKFFIGKNQGKFLSAFRLMYIIQDAHYNVRREPFIDEICFIRAQTHM